MSAPPKVKLKLNTGQVAPAQKSFSAQTPTPSTSGLKLNFNKGVGAGSPPASSPPSLSLHIPKIKTAKSSKATSNSKKRSRELDEQNAVLRVQTKKQTTVKISQKPAIGKMSVIKLMASNGSKTIPTTPNAAQTRLKIKARGKLPARPTGVGYDSEAEDAERDPANEDNIILRMAPGPDCEYLRQAIEERKVGLPVSQGGADVSLRFFTRDGRRAGVNVRGNHYAAALVDLPCIVESMKSWDKRGWWKSADICQMLVVTGKVGTEEAAKTYPLPKDIDEKAWQWPHGLTPPMHNVRKRRFRKRVSHRTIEAAEEEVERLLAADEQAKAQQGSSQWEILDLDALRREEIGEDAYDEGEDAEGDVDEEYSIVEDHEETTAEAMARMEQALGADDEEEDAAPVTNHPAAPMPTEEAEILPVTDGNVASPDFEVQEVLGEEDDEEDEDEEDDEDEEEVEVDEDAREQAHHLAQQREEIAYLEQQLAMQREAYNKQANPLLRQRLVGKIKSYEADLHVKKRALGVADEEG